MAETRESLSDVFSGGGEMGRRMQVFDWSQTPLGPVSGWPQALRTAIRIMLTSRQPMFVWWGDELTNLYNDAHRSILGGKHPEALGQPAAVVWREIWDQVGPRAQAAMHGNKGTYDEALFLLMERHGYREETYYTFSYSPVPADTGGTCGIFCANTDDTRRIISERQLALLRLLAAETADARTIEAACIDAAHSLETNPHDLPFALIYLIDREHQCLTLACRANIPADHPAAVKAVPLDAPADLPIARVVQSGEPILLIDIPPSFAPVPAGAWDRPPNQLAILPIAAAGQTGPAGVLVVGLNPYRIYDEDYQRFLGLVSGQIAAAIANAQAYEAERQRAEALAELDRAKTQFFSNVSHEFRTPLTLLLGPLEDALDTTRDESVEAQRDQLQLAHRNALRLLRLVNTLLDFSRLEAGRMQASFQRTDLSTFTADLASTFRAAAERAGLRWIVDCPPLPPEIETYVDRDMWEKIVLNLLSNAFKFTLSGEVVIGLRPTANGSAVELAVRDTGAGIPAAELPRLFERFHRVHGTQARTHEGTGIGLALVQELVKMHGGAIAVDSSIGRGTTFTVTIPTGTDHLPHDRIDAGSTLESTATGAAPYVEEALRWLPDSTADAVAIRQDLTALIDPQEPLSSIPSGGRVLFVDDNADMRQYVTRLLSPLYAVEAVPDGAAALASVRAHPPDLVLSDIMMPRLDGLGLLRALRADPATRDLPVVLLSARAGEEASAEGLAAGADDYLIKPFTARELRARVTTHVALRRMRAEATRREQEARTEAETERTRLREILAQAPAAIALVTGPEHTFTLANAEYCRMTGRNPVGQSVRAAFPEVAGQGLIEILDRIRETGEPFTATELPIRLARDGRGEPSEGFYNVSCQPIKDAAEQVTSIFGHAVDVTEQVHARQRLETEVAERRRMEQERAHLLAREQKARLEAEAAVRARDDFLSIAAHELRTPVAAIKGMAQLTLRAASRGMMDSTRAEKALRTIEQSVDRLTTLINDLLDVSRLQRGQLRLRPQRIDLVEFVRDIASRHAELLDHDHELKIESGDATVPVAADPGRLEQVFDNLFSNAIKYSPGGGAIVLDVRREAERAWVAVQDSGIGLPAGETEHIFEPFGRASNATDRNLPGMGLGLHVSRRIVELHGGRLWAESDGEDRGTTFHLWLPLAGLSRGGEGNVE